jgi:hypothetical protein
MPADRVASVRQVRRTAARLAGVVALLLVIGRNAEADTWAERLGFPSGHKVLLIHAHEFGMCHESNAATTKLMDSGALQSASAMAPCPWFADAAAWSKDHPNADIGLELTLNSEFERYRWQPVAADRLLESLRDADGYLWKSPIQIMANAETQDVEHELAAQINRARQLGLTPTHLTTHLGALVTRPDLIEAYLRVARRHWIPATVVELTPEHIARFEEQGFPLPDDIVQLLVDYPLPKVDDLRFVGDAPTYDDKKRAFLTMLQELQPGLTQVAFRPAERSDALPRIALDWEQRVWDAQLLADEDVLGALNDANVTLTTWREIMQRFSGTATSGDEASDGDSLR